MPLNIKLQNSKNFRQNCCFGKNILTWPDLKRNRLPKSQGSRISTNYIPATKTLHDLTKAIREENTSVQPHRNTPHFMQIWHQQTLFHSH